MIYRASIGTKHFHGTIIKEHANSLSIFEKVFLMNQMPNHRRRRGCRQKGDRHAEQDKQRVMNSNNSWTCRHRQRCDEWNGRMKHKTDSIRKTTATKSDLYRNSCPRCRTWQTGRSVSTESNLGVLTKVDREDQSRWGKERSKYANVDVKSGDQKWVGSNLAHSCFRNVTNVWIFIRARGVLTDLPIRLSRLQVERETKSLNRKDRQVFVKIDNLINQLQINLCNFFFITFGVRVWQMRDSFFFADKVRWRILLKVWRHWPTWDQTNKSKSSFSKQMFPGQSCHWASLDGQQSSKSISGDRERWNGGNQWVEGGEEDDDDSSFKLD